jgi:hypothetical protein
MYIIRNSKPIALKDYKIISSCPLFKGASNSPELIHRLLQLKKLCIFKRDASLSQTACVYNDSKCGTAGQF